MSAALWAFAAAVALLLAFCVLVATSLRQAARRETAAPPAPLPAAGRHEPLPHYEARVATADLGAEIPDDVRLRRREILDRINREHATARHRRRR